MSNHLIRIIPGIGLLVLIGSVAYTIGPIVGINHLLLAIALGILVVNTVGLPRWAEPGIGTRELWLETGIVLLGSQLMIEAVLRSGLRILLVVVGTVLFTGLLVEVLARKLFRVEEKLGSLLAAGSSVCGVSAIIAVSGSIRADEQQIAYAVATVLLFDAITVFIYPIIGNFFEIPAQTYGIWAGVSMFSTGPVVAAGFAHSDVAGQWATVTKITRNLFIAVVALGYSLLYAQRGTKMSPSVGFLWAKFPKFLIGFILLAVVVNTGVFSSSQISTLGMASELLFLVAFAGLGLTITVDDLRTAGPRPVLLVIVAFMIISIVSFSVVSILFSG